MVKIMQISRFRYFQVFCYFLLKLFLIYSKKSNLQVRKKQKIMFVPTILHFSIFYLNPLFVYKTTQNYNIKRFLLLFPLFGVRLKKSHNLNILLTKTRKKKLY